VLDFAISIVFRAGRLAREHFFDGPSHRAVKDDGSEVTDADVAVEDLIRAELDRKVPDDEVYGEEAGITTGTSGRRWIIDPIDGTSCFTRRLPLFDTRLAYEDEHGPAIGIIYQPGAEQLIFAGRGLGCWRITGAAADPDAAGRVQVADRRQLRGARTGMTNPGTWSEELLAALHRTLFMDPTGSAVGVATGQIHAHVVAGVPMGYEDLAPLPVILHEAGGRVTDLSGQPVLTGDGTALISNDSLHDELLALIAGLPRCRDWMALVSVDRS
jgi:histidinol-phosphatase